MNQRPDLLNYYEASRRLRYFVFFILSMDQSGAKKAICAGLRHKLRRPSGSDKEVPAEPQQQQLAAASSSSADQPKSLRFFLAQAALLLHREACYFQHLF
jgi:hypothetical protein